MGTGRPFRRPASRSIDERQGDFEVRPSPSTVAGGDAPAVPDDDLFGDRESQAEVFPAVLRGTIRKEAGRGQFD